MGIVAEAKQASGRQYADNSDIGADTFESVFGRPPTEEELKIVNHQWHTYGVYSHTNKVDGKYTSHSQVVESLKNTMDSALNYATKVASANGIDLTPEQLQEISSAYITPSDLAGTRLNDASARDAVVDKIRDMLTAHVNRIGMENIRNPKYKEDDIGNVQRLFQSVYGRSASEDEAIYFAKEIARGKSTYELSQELMALPEYQRVQAQKDRSALDVELQQQQAEVFKRATPQIISSFMRAGRLNSSGLQAAMAQAQADLERERQGSLAQVGVADNATIRANAFGDFLRRDQPYQMGREMFSTPNSYSTAMNMTRQGLARQRELEDYYRQASDYNRYLAMSTQGNRGAGALQGALSGAAAGAATGNPWGALVGAGLGGFGGYLAYR